MMIQSTADSSVAWWSAALNWLEQHPVVALLVGVTVLVLVAYLADIIAKRRLLGLVKRVTAKTRFTWDDVFLQHRVFDRAAQAVPIAVIYYGIDLIPGVGDGAVRGIRNIAAALFILVIVRAIASALAAGNAIYEKYPAATERPIKGFVQVAQIIVYVVGAVLIVAALMDESPVVFLGGIGAMTAVLMLVFKDTILSLVASVQITSNDMVRVGDWIEMPKYSADGDVTDIALHTVTVQNWDKTVTTIPTYKLIAESFKNWRTMPESGGRRIKRSIHLDAESVRFLTDEELARFKQFTLLQDYIQRKEGELREYNARLGDGVDGNVNARRLTNLGTFRAYVRNYLKHHPQINQDMTLLVRQRPPTPHGIPLEIYVFTSDTAWLAHEDIQSDIFDHVLAIVGEFGLRVAQNPTGSDIRALARA